MTSAMVPASQAIFPSRTGTALPALILRAGEKARWRFIDFFTATIRNPNTRRAYYLAVSRFLNWCQTQGIWELDKVRPIHVAAYVEQLQGELARPSVKQHLAAIRKCLNWLLSGGVLEMNPASPVQGPKYIVRVGQTPILDAEETRQLLDSILLDYVVGLRDRALVGVMLYTFGRVGAVTAMNVEDYFVSGRRPMFRLHEKGGKNHLVPAHHNAQEYVEEYLEAAGVRNGPKAPLFQSADPARRTLTGRRLLTRNALAMVKRRARAAGLPETTRCHTMRATAITNYLQNGGPRRTPGPWRPMSRRRPPGCTITPGTTLPWTRLSGSGFDRGILPGTSKPL